MESTLPDPSYTQPAGGQQPADEAESEPTGTQQSIDTHESEPKDELEEETESEPVVEERRYPRRQRKASSRYLAIQYVLLTDEGELECYEKSITDVHMGMWYNAMQDETDSLHENHTYELMEFPEGKKALRNKWVYKLKIGEDGSTPKYKAHIVVKSFQ